jgi:hypothetical protein
LRPELLAYGVGPPHEAQEGVIPQPCDGGHRPVAERARAARSTRTAMAVDRAGEEGDGVKWLQVTAETVVRRAGSSSCGVHAEQRGQQAQDARRPACWVYAKSQR